MDFFHFVKQSKFPKNAELTLEVMTSELKGLKKARPAMVDALVENCLFTPSKNIVLRLQVTTLLLNFYSNAENNTLGKEIFLKIFNNESSHIFPLLYNLISTALYTKNANLLDAAANWMKQTGLNSKAVMDLVKKLLDDDTLHITMQPYNPLSIPFIKNCLVIITRIHPQKLTNQKPPIDLKTVSLICDWMEVDPTICHMDNLNNHEEHTLQILLQWSVLGCLHDASNSEKHWNRLQYLILSSLSLFTLINVFKLQPFDDLISLIVPLKNTTAKSENLEYAVDKVCQFIQIALSTGVLSASADDLRSFFTKVPNTRLVQLIKKKNSL